MYNQYNHISELNLTVSSRDEQTIIEDVYFTAPLKITKPFFKNNWLLIMLISVSAGLMSGDAQLLNLHIKKEKGVLWEIFLFIILHSMKKLVVAEMLNKKSY